jgi:hypothetical protein
MYIVASILFFAGISQLRDQTKSVKIFGLLLIAAGAGIVFYNVTHPIVIEVPAAP